MSELAEQNVIGALLIDNQALNEIYNDLKPDMFTNKVLLNYSHSHLYNYCLWLQW